MSERRPADPLMQRLHDERIVILDVSPQVDAGRYPVKRILGDELIVGATLAREGHDLLAGVLLHLHEDEKDWREEPLTCHGEGRWSGRCTLERLGMHQYTLLAWTDAFGTWREQLRKKHEALIPDLKAELAEGAALAAAAGQRASGADQNLLLEAAVALSALPQDEAVALGLDLKLQAAVARWAERKHATRFDRILSVLVERPRARCGAWYELFPRSQTDDPRKHGTLRGVIRRLPEIARMGFDVLYLPPIHPIGVTNRKGKNNALKAEPDDVGSPWAVGNQHGGHDAIEPKLGALADFQALVQAAAEHGMEIALDFAIQCSPDHPYVKAHPQWFRHRPDGSIAYAENPPKKYQDIYPIDFDTPDWQKLWREWERVLLFWISLGVKIFRVDNPHTKPMGFWEWLLGAIRKRNPDVVFLSEAFTDPARMKTLAKLGFSQSYTYFTWINDKDGLVRYFTELTRTEMVDWFRGNLFANTPDILNAYLQHGGRAAFKIRAALAATLSSNWGIYSGFELCERVPAKPGSEEYQDSEKFEVKVRDWDRPQNLCDYLHRLNAARKRHPALQLYANLVFHHSPTPDVLCYSKATPDKQDAVIVVANVNPHEARQGDVHLNLWELGLGENEEFEVEDQLTGNVWRWKGSRNFVRLEPDQEPAHVLTVRR